MAVQHAFLEALLSEHARLREVLATLCHAIAHTAGRQGRTLDIQRVLALLEQLEEVDAGHHPREDRLLFPRIRQRCPALGPVLTRMEQEHVRMVPMYRELTQALEWAALQERVDRASLAEQVRHFADLALGHLGVEDDYILPVAADFLSEQDWSDMESADPQLCRNLSRIGRE